MQIFAWFLAVLLLESLVDGQEIACTEGKCGAPPSQSRAPGGRVLRERCIRKAGYDFTIA